MPITLSETPIPMPAFAPVDKPSDCATLGGEEGVVDGGLVGEAVVVKS
jgi:hypothetical protein